MAVRDRPVTLISPSILSADFAALGRDVERLWTYGAEWVHVDCMDGHFVPNLTIGPPVVAAIRKRTKAFLDCHLMLEKPAEWVEEFAKAGADGYCFHFEAVVESIPPSTDDMEKVRDACRKIREYGMKAGVAIKPGTDAVHIEGLVREGLIDMVLCMTVEPGFGGQSFKPEVMPKVTSLRKMFPDLNIQVDGGLSPKTIDIAAKAGANVIVAGSAVFLADDPPSVIEILRQSVDKAADQRSTQTIH